MSYWTKKSNYTENKKTENIKKIYNKKTMEDEFIKLTDYINSYGDFRKETNEIEIKKNNTKILKDFDEEITKKINLQNITNNENASIDEMTTKENIRKILSYANELKKELKDKENN